MKKIILILILVLLVLWAWPVAEDVLLSNQHLLMLTSAEVPDWIDQQIIEIDGDSRRGEHLEGLNDIVIHYVGNPGTTAQQNRNYYSNPDSSVSSHFVIGLKGEIIQCIPLGEKSSASNDRNRDTISIEVCHPDESGKFTGASYQSLVKLTAWLCQNSGLSQKDLIRHYDITGKNCPKYFVDHEDAWDTFRKDVQNHLS